MNFTAKRGIVSFFMFIIARRVGVIRFRWIARRFPFILSSWCIAQQLVAAVVVFIISLTILANAMLASTREGRKTTTKKDERQKKDFTPFAAHHSRRDGNERNKSHSMASLVPALSSSHGTIAFRKDYTATATTTTNLKLNFITALNHHHLPITFLRCYLLLFSILLAHGRLRHLNLPFVTRSNEIPSIFFACYSCSQFDARTAVTEPSSLSDCCWVSEWLTCDQANRAPSHWLIFVVRCVTFSPRSKRNGHSSHSTIFFLLFIRFNNRRRHNTTVNRCTKLWELRTTVWHTVNGIVVVALLSAPSLWATINSFVTRRTTCLATTYRAYGSCCNTLN